MRGLKQTVLSAAASAALFLLPATPAAAAGPLLFAPWVLGRVIDAGVRLATLPLTIASAAAAQQSAPPYAPAPSYYGGPAGNAQPRYNAPPPAYYSPPPAYYTRRPANYYYPARPAYYGPSLAYARPSSRYYGQPRGYYVPSGRLAYRHW
jgi:hypothetical protein